MQKQAGKLYIGGQWLETEQHIDVFNPATLEKIADAPLASPVQVTAAVDAAAAALPAWRARTAQERAVLMLKWHALIEEHREQIARTMTEEQGKPYPEALGEVTYANSFVQWYAEEGKRVYGDTVPASHPDKRIITIKQPVGVVAAITPWNFPAAMITRKISPAIAAGCTVVIKPSELTPLTAYLLAGLAEQAGIPAGVLNVITGDPEQIGKLWMEDTRVRKVSFTGSTRVGKLLMASAAATVKNISLELGGHAPFIVTRSADLDLAVQHFIGVKFRNAGQTCVCPNRVYVHSTVKEAFVSKLTDALEVLKVGNGLEEGVAIGALINAQGKEKVLRHIDDAQAQGAKVIRAKQTLPEQGYFVAPTLLVDVQENMLCMNEETFGPVAPILAYDTLEEVIRKANDTPYGLAAYVFSQQLTEAFHLSEALDYGIIGLNDGFPATAQAPFGGMKESGLGREGGYWGLDEFLETKYISMNLG